MILLIPAIEIKDGRCVQMVQGEEGFYYSDDPVQMARLWRQENAKSLHVTDIDGKLTGHLVNVDVIKEMTNSVDIPIELGGGLRTFESVKLAFDLGMYRVLVGSKILDNEDEARKVVSTYGASKVVLGIDAVDGMVVIYGTGEPTGKSAVEIALKGKELGFKRVVYTNVRNDGTFRGVNIAVLRELAEKVGMRVTASGGLGGLHDLLAIQELETVGVDSVIVGRALYENKFSCQGLWRRCEAGKYPFTAKV